MLAFLLVPLEQGLAFLEEYDLRAIHISLFTYSFKQVSLEDLLRARTITGTGNALRSPGVEALLTDRYLAS